MVLRRPLRSPSAPRLWGFLDLRLRSSLSSDSFEYLRDLDRNLDSGSMLADTQSETFSWLSMRWPRCRLLEVGSRGETEATAVAEDFEGETIVHNLGGDLFRESFLAPGEVEESGPRCLDRPRSARPLNDASSRAEEEEPD